MSVFSWRRLIKVLNHLVTMPREASSSSRGCKQSSSRRLALSKWSSTLRKLRSSRRKRFYTHRNRLGSERFIWIPNYQGWGESWGHSLENSSDCYSLKFPDLPCLTPLMENSSDCFSLKFPDLPCLPPLIFKYLNP